MNNNFNISNIKIIHYAHNSNDPFPEPIQLVLEGYDVDSEVKNLREFAFYTTHDSHIANNLTAILKHKSEISSDLLRKWGFMVIVHSECPVSD